MKKHSLYENFILLSCICINQPWLKQSSLNWTCNQNKKPVLGRAIVWLRQHPWKNNDWGNFQGLIIFLGVYDDYKQQRQGKTKLRQCLSLPVTIYSPAWSAVNLRKNTWPQWALNLSLWYGYVIPVSWYLVLTGCPKSMMFALNQDLVLAGVWLPSCVIYFVIGHRVCTCDTWH